MLDAIEILHNQGYIHCDIKPSNFAMGLKKKRSEVFIIDFGLAKHQVYFNGIIKRYYKK